MFRTDELAFATQRKAPRVDGVFFPSVGWKNWDSYRRTFIPSPRLGLFALCRSGGSRLWI